VRKPKSPETRQATGTVRRLGRGSQLKEKIMEHARQQLREQAPTLTSVAESPVRESSDLSTGTEPPLHEWIGTTRAKRILDIGSEHTVRSWALDGHLRYRILPTKRLQVLAEDVINLARTYATYEHPDDSPLTDEELEDLYSDRVSKAPWERRKTKSH